MVRFYYESFATSQRNERQDEINYAWRSRIIFSGFSHHRLLAFILNQIFYPFVFPAPRETPFKHTLCILSELKFMMELGGNFLDDAQWWDLR